MKGKILAVVLSVLFLASSAMALEIGGVDIPEMMKADKDNLILNGAGVRKFAGLLKTYVGGLYLLQKTIDRDAIMDADEPMALKLHIVSGLVSNDKLVKAFKEGMETSTGGNVAPYQAKMDEFFGLFKDEVQDNDVYDLVYLPSSGINVFKNGKKIGAVVGKDFKKVFFGIWLNENNSGNLKDVGDAMLGL